MVDSTIMMTIRGVLRQALKPGLVLMASVVCLGIASVLAGHLYGVVDWLFAVALGGGALISGIASILLFFRFLRYLSPHPIIRTIGK